LIREFISRMSIEDKVVFTRLLAGIIYGFIAYIMYRLGFILLYDNSTTIWFIAGAVYIATMVYVDKRFGVRTWFLLLLRGLLTYYLSWITVLLILYDLLG